MNKCPWCNDKLDSKEEQTTFPYGIEQTEIPVTLIVYHCKKCNEYFLTDDSEDAKQIAINKYYE